MIEQSESSWVDYVVSRAKEEISAGRSLILAPEEKTAFLAGWAARTDNA